ncbi:MAG: hypothetical protein ACPL3C_02460 [Pyrobaculum sp.]|uniref:hypothetical protein n=1 Tax=Pyrobaculum sp. TaxID=2004705 RepID=UPI003C7FEE1E
MSGAVFYYVIPWLKKAVGFDRVMVIADVKARGFVKADVYVNDMDRREVEYSPDYGGYVCTVEQCYADILSYGEAGPYLVDLLWSRGLYDVDKIYALSGPRGRAILAALVVWDMLLRGRSVSWGAFDPYREEFLPWLNYVARWATGYILEDGARDTASI